MRYLLIAGLCALLLSGCATPPVENDPNPAGFWFGLWNGMTLFFSFIGSLFSENIAVYDASNKGGLYDFGFLLGVSLVFGGSGASS